MTSHRGVRLVQHRRLDGLEILLCGLLAAVLLPAILDAGGLEAPPECDLAVLERSGAVIGTVTLQVADIFDTSDPNEDRALFRLANRLHFKTRDGVVRRRLLFRSGDPFSRRLLEESERVLRTTHYLYDARIRVVGCADGVVDVHVWTRDVWTLDAGFGFRREGGKNSFDFEVSDSNFLGFGKDMTLARHQDVDRTVSLLHYRDVNFTGRWMTLEVWLADNSDGRRRALVLEQPFYSLESNWSAGFRGNDEVRVDSLYTLGEVSDRYRHELKLAELFWGRSRGLVRGRTVRWTLGGTYDRHRFSAAPDGSQVIPTDRTLVYPWVGVELLQDRYTTVRDIDTIARTEDLNLGAHLRARLGYSADLLGASRNAAVVDFRASTGHRLRDGMMVLLRGSSSWRWGSGGPENLLAGAGVRLYVRDWGRQLFFATLSADLGRNLDGDTRIELGGDSGLRGYPLRYQTGDRRVLATLEQRFFSNWYPFRLFHVGGAVFVDAGKAWTAGAPSPSDRGVLKDVGVGLRFASSRSSSGAMLHLDLAFPLDRDGGIKAVQWLVSTKETF